MHSLRKSLSGAGICALKPLLSEAELVTLNDRIDPLFESRAEERRSYVTVDEIYSLGLFDIVFKREIQDILFAAVLEPVLYHFHLYETAGNASQPHIFSETLSGWHRDIDSEYVSGSPTHVSLFIYLSDVGIEDGPFEFLPGDPTRMMTGTAATVSVLGPPGKSFIWNRSFYHRAAPNRAPQRRRLLKISVQHQKYPSIHLSREAFRNLQEAVPVGDPRLDLFLGRGGSLNTELPLVSEPQIFEMRPNSAISVPTSKILKAQIKGKLRSMKQALGSGHDSNKQATVVYD